MDDWVVQDFSGGSHCRCGGNSKRTRMRSGAWRCDWIATLSLWNLNRWGVSFHGWAKKVVYWVGIYFWWQCYEVVEMTRKDLEYYINLVD